MNNILHNISMCTYPPPPHHHVFFSSIILSHGFSHSTTVRNMLLGCIGRSLPSIAAPSCLFASIFLKCVISVNPLNAWYPGYELHIFTKLVHVICQTRIAIIIEAQQEESTFAHHHEAYLIPYFAIPIGYEVLYSPIPLQLNAIVMNKYLLIRINMDSKRFKTWFGPCAYYVVGKLEHENKSD